jgi:hypothetical protein
MNRERMEARSDETRRGSARRATAVPEGPPPEDIYDPYTCLGKRPWGPYGLDVSDYGKGGCAKMEWAMPQAARAASLRPQPASQSSRSGIAIAGGA